MVSSEQLAKAYETELQHLIRMASIPGAKAHAWHRAKELDKVDIFKGIAQALVEYMNAVKEQKAANSQ